MIRFTSINLILTFLTFSIFFIFISLSNRECKLYYGKDHYTDLYNYRCFSKLQEGTKSNPLIVKFNRHTNKIFNKLNISEDKEK